MIELFPRCPNPSCNALLDDATNVTGPPRPIRPGDFSVCAYCATIVRATPSLGYRVVHEGELLAVDRTRRDMLRVLREELRRKPFPKRSETGRRR